MIDCDDFDVIKLITIYDSLKVYYFHSLDCIPIVNKMYLTANEGSNVGKH